MKNKHEKRLRKMQSKAGLMVSAGNDEPVRVLMLADGAITLSSALDDTFGGIGQITIAGLSKKKAASKKKSFWRRLWDKVKGAVATVVDAVTVPVFGYRCRPDVDIDFNKGQFIFGIKCTEA